MSLASWLACSDICGAIAQADREQQHDDDQAQAELAAQVEVTAQQHAQFVQQDREQHAGEHQQQGVRGEIHAGQQGEEEGGDAVDDGEPAHQAAFGGGGTISERY